MPTTRDAGFPSGARPDQPQQRVLARRHQQAPGEALTGAAAEREAEMMDDALQPRRPVRKGATMSSPNRSAKILLAQWPFVQRNRRTVSVTRTRRP
jgi:hypothetical protein